MSKISLVTYHYSHNVGAVLQTYALCRYLKEHGFEVEIIDIRHLETNLKNISEGSPLPIRLIKYVLYPIRMRNIIKNFYPSITRHYLSLEELKDNPPQSDFYVVGSDQVWNPNISRDRVLAYFLDFGDERIKRFSYASSFGLTNWESGSFVTTVQIKRCLDRFNCISVRELEGQAILKKTFGKDATIVLDPTFLNENYPEITGSVKQHNEIVCYKLEKTQDFWDFMPIVSEKTGLPVLLLNYNYPKKGYKYHFNPTVKQWVSRIAGATFVITDSFHGVAFSIIYKRQFAAVINHNGKESRIVSLLKLLHLEDRIFDSVEELSKSDCWKMVIDYNNVDYYLSALKNQSETYLKLALNIDNE